MTQYSRLAFSLTDGNTEMGNKYSWSTTYINVLKITNMQTVHNFDMCDKFNAVGICEYCTMNFAE